MKKHTIKIVCASSLILLLSTNAHAFAIKQPIGDLNTNLKIFGFTQLYARGSNNTLNNDTDSNIHFGAQNVRLGVNYSAGPIRSKLLMDFSKPTTDVSGVGLPNYIQDSFISYHHDYFLTAKFGLIKMPHGMGYTTAGWNLDTAERSFDKPLALERNVGLMLSGRNIGFGYNAKVNGLEMGHERAWKGFGYDVMYGNQAGRSGAVVGAKKGDSNSYAIRGMFDWTELLHTEISYGESKSAAGLGVLNDVDYKSLNIGLESHFGRSSIKFEHYDSENIQGVKGWDISTYSFTKTYLLTNTFEPSLKHIQGSSSKDGVKTTLGNTYLGFNYYIAPFDNKIDRNSKRNRNAHRIQLNYIISSGDTAGYSVEWNGLKGKLGDSWLAQYQYKF